MVTGGTARIPAVTNATADALGQEDMGLKPQKEGLCGRSIRSGVRDEPRRAGVVQGLVGGWLVSQRQWEAAFCGELCSKGRAVTSVEGMDLKGVRGEAGRSARRPLSVRGGGGLE